MTEIIRDAFKLHDTYGFPLEIQVGLASDRGMIISLPDFYVDAIAAGWKNKKALSVIRNSLVDAVKAAEADKLMEELHKFIWAMDSTGKDQKVWAASIKLSLDKYWNKRIGE